MYAGTLTGVPGLNQVHVTIKVDPDLPATCRAEAELWCIRSTAGEIFELGTPNLSMGGSGEPSERIFEDSFQSREGEFLPASVLGGMNWLSR